LLECRDLYPDANIPSFIMEICVLEMLEAKLVVFHADNVMFLSHDS
jgi:hypothetical protein